jgi:hypothetical protein
VHRHLRFPLAHRWVIRTTNLLERLFGEERRRAKVIPHAFRRTRRTQTDVRYVDPRGRTLARVAHDGIRAPPTDRYPQRAQPRLRENAGADFVCLGSHSAIEAFDTNNREIDKNWTAVAPSLSVARDGRLADGAEEF